MSTFYVFNVYLFFLSFVLITSMSCVLSEQVCIINPSPQES